MALSATLRQCTIELADIDRGIYETLEFRVAQHPSENPERLVIRLLARALAHEENLEFGRGLAAADEPALWVQGVQNDVSLWIDVGAPSADRLHRASKRADRVMVFTDKSAIGLKKEWGSRKIHGAQSIEVVYVPTELLGDLANSLGRQNKWVLTFSDGYLSIGVAEDTFEAQIERGNVAEACT